MKRIVIVIVMLAIFLCGCEPGIPVPEGEEEFMLPDGVFISYNILHFNDFEEYQKYFAFPPEGFIPWRVLKRFGEFSHWRDLELDFGPDGDAIHDDYLYIFGEYDTSCCSLYVHKKPWDENDIIHRHGIPSTWEADANDPDNLWTAVNPRYHRYDLNENAYYVYRNGKLDSICWRCGTYHFELSLERYKLGANRYIDLLLDADTAEAALNDFNADVEWKIRR